jgi:protein-S-isoprenylcysteine O-methyltransferase Ste14
MKFRLKINGVIIILALLLVAVFPSLFFRNGGESLLDNIFELLGFSFILLGQIIRVSARGYKAENSLQGNVLINSGPYALVRNLMYLGILLIGTGIVLTLFRWWAFSIFLSVFVLRYIILIFKEEKKLKKVFPQEYLLYQEKVPRLIPSISILLKKDRVKYLPLKLSWIKKEIGSVLAVLLGTILLESWADIKNNTLPAYIKELSWFTAILLLFVALVVYLNMRTKALKKDV